MWNLLMEGFIHLCQWVKVMKSSVSICEEENCIRSLLSTMDIGPSSGVRVWCIEGMLYDLPWRLFCYFYTRSKPAGGQLWSKSPNCGLWCSCYAGVTYDWCGRVWRPAAWYNSLHGSWGCSAFVIDDTLCCCDCAETCSEVYVDSVLAFDHGRGQMLFRRLLFRHPITSIYWNG